MGRCFQPEATVRPFAADSAAGHDRDHHAQLFCLIAGDNIDQIFAGNTGDQPQRGTDNTEDGIKENRSFVADTVGEDPFPVVDDLPEGTVLDTACQGMQGLKVDGLLVFMVGSIIGCHDDPFTELLDTKLYFPVFFKAIHYYMVVYSDVNIIQVLVNPRTVFKN